jgi:glycosyltransferase involved in cell wall biosynthesis
MKVKSLPHLSHFDTSESGIKRVVEAYFKYLPDYDIELVHPDSEDYDLLVCHAGMGDGTADVSHLHGLYWTADYPDPPTWEMDANKRIVNDIRHAKQVTVPSPWVAETFQRDLRYTPHIIGHGIEWQEWQHNHSNESYILWNKNRTGDVCDPEPLNRLAKQFPQEKFVTTFGDKKENVYVIDGIVKHEQMKQLVQQAGVYLSTTKETFGIGVLEAMAAGVPVLGWKFGGNVDLVEHGINGYLAKPNDYDDLANGLNYCLQNRQMLGDNGCEMAKTYTWLSAVERVADVYQLALEVEELTVSVVIPVYNKEIEQIERALMSCINQSINLKEIVIVDDGSDDEKAQFVYDGFNASDLSPQSAILRFVKQDNQGVAYARNNGIAQATSKYICCLDADDWLEPTFLETCVTALESDRTLGVAFTHLKWHSPDGITGLGGFNSDGKGEPWPPFAWDFDRQVNYKKRLNQIPTCAVFKREMWERLGGYRQRYAPQGAGAEDAEFWTRAGAYGYKAEKVSHEPLFNYSIGSGQVSGDKQYREVDWLAWHPWAQDNQHPLASYATPDKKSHPVRQYDEPIVSVIIPVGPGHEQEVINALDSLEAQTMRRWEVVVVDDTDWVDMPSSSIRDYSLIFEPLKTAYPYIKLINTTGLKGTGYARNRGTEIARAPFVLFLDADDTLHPDCLQEMLEAWQYQQKIIYSDYVGQAFIEPELAQKYQDKNRLFSYNDGTHEAIIRGNLPEFDCALAIQQPTDKPYLWCNITCLVPKAWHEEIGGFDESMETWEDIDYWWRMARAGKCFHKIDKELMRYRYYTGNRRHIASQDTLEGRQIAKTMLEYLQSKYQGIETMPCGCKDDKKTTVISSEVQPMSDSQYTRAKYLGRRGNHHIIGAFEMSYNPGVASRRKGNNWVHYYGYAQEGYITLVHNEDIRLMVGKWQVVPEVNIPQPKEIELPPPVALQSTTIEEILDKPDFALDNLPGVTPAIANRMAEFGLDTKEKILAYDLTTIKGVAEKRAKIIKAALEK